MIQSVVCRFAICSGPADATQTEYCHKRHNFLHASHHFLPMRSVICFPRTEAHKVLLTLGRLPGKV